MSEKLTEQKIDEMIKELLQEQTINVAIDNPPKQNKAQRKREAGPLGTPPIHAEGDDG